MKKRFFFVLVVFLVISSVKSQNDLYLKKQFIYKGDTLPYRIMYPENFNNTEKYPLVIFLHGSGERGNDNESQLKWGSELFTKVQNRKDFPVIVIFPQCPAKGYWAPIKSRQDGFSYVNSKHSTEPMQLVIRLINELKKSKIADKKRIYVMGISMGGMGTYDLICRNPKSFAAAIPICGGVSLKRLKKVRKMPIRIYHGADDNIVSPEHSRNAYIELKANGAQNVEITIFPGVNHNSWTQTFEVEDLLSWLFSNKLK